METYIIICTVTAIYALIRVQIPAYIKAKNKYSLQKNGDSMILEDGKWGQVITFFIFVFLITVILAPFLFVPTIFKREVSIERTADVIYKEI